MSVLYNRISNKELYLRLLTENKQRNTVSFYRYFIVNDPQNFRDTLYRTLSKLQVFGRIYIAEEGINAQISVPKDQFSTMCAAIHAIRPLSKIKINVALDNNSKSFWVLRMKVRKRIIADGIKDFTFNPSNTGHYLKAKEVNILKDDPDVLFIDMRNHYEYEIGHFYGAIEIPANTFREQLLTIVKMLQKYKNRKIVLYCTGGIRCEKASAWMLHNGFKHIYQVEGGIIGYTNHALKQKLPLKFIGKNFVFDKRLGERITLDVISHCHQCGTSCDDHTNCYNKKCHLLFIQCIKCSIKYHNCCSLICKKEIS